MNGKEKGEENGKSEAFAAATDGVWSHSLTKRELFAMVFTHAWIVGGRGAFSDEAVAELGIGQADELLRMLEKTDEKEEKKK